MESTDRLEQLLESNGLTRRELLRGAAVLLGASVLGGTALTFVEGCAQIAPGAKLELPEFTAWGVIDAQISSQQILADKKGYYKDEGLKVTNKLTQSGPDIGPMIAGGSAPISFETNITVISVAANDVPAVIVATLANIAGTQAVVGRKGLVLNSAKDLEGKKVGMARGAGVLIAIRKMCKDLGVDIEKIKFITMQPADQVAALEKGDIDAMAAWEPWITKGISVGGKFLFSGKKADLPEKKGSVDWMDFHTTLQVTQDYLNKYPTTLTAMIRALKKATDFVNNNRSEAIELLSPELHLSKEELKEMMDRNIYSMVMDESFVNGCKTISDFMFELKNIPKIPDMKKYVNSSLLAKVDPNLVKVTI